MAVRASDIMTKDVITIPREMDARSAALVLTSHKISGAPVVDSDHTLVGVISDGDLVRNSARTLEPKDNLSPYFTRREIATLKEIQASNDSQDGTMARVGDLMTPYAVSTEENAEVSSLARIMLDQKVHRILILKEDRLTGIVSSMDIVRAVAEFGLGGRRLRSPRTGEKAPVVNQSTPVRRSRPRPASTPAKVRRPVTKLNRRRTRRMSR